MRFALTAAALALGVALAACSSHPPYDETAHRAAIERLSGHPVRDWATFLSEARAICAEDDDKFALTAAVFSDHGDLPVFEMNVRYLCPDRSDELAADEAVWRRDPCANPTTDSERRIAEASGCKP